MACKVPDKMKSWTGFYSFTRRAKSDKRLQDPCRADLLSTGLVGKITLTALLCHVAAPT